MHISCEYQVSESYSRMGRYRMARANASSYEYTVSSLGSPSDDPGRSDLRQLCNEQGFSHRVGSSMHLEHLQLFLTAVHCVSSDLYNR
ncbi:hypothetical protein MRB53_041497 [Persea americana]|nr:hypothetical protein MRB53_041497 [Persea americana]